MRGQCAGRSVATLESGKWVGGDTISVSNGSGYNNYTPLQVAHAVANLTNNGVVSSAVVFCAASASATACFAAGLNHWSRGKNSPWNGSPMPYLPAGSALSAVTI